MRQFFGVPLPFEDAARSCRSILFRDRIDVGSQFMARHTRHAFNIDHALGWDLLPLGDCLRRDAPPEFGGQPRAAVHALLCPLEGVELALCQIAHAQNESITFSNPQAFLSVTFIA